MARLHIIQVLSRFNRPDVQQAIQKQLKDNSKLIRSAALSRARPHGWARSTCRCSTSMLRDPEIEVQNKAVDVVVKANHPDTVKYLVEVLKDENEYARRAAVEVLNAVGTSKSVKYLLEVIADSDWWVRTRAADALGKIGGPRVVDAVMSLIKDENQDIRRAAIEILNQTKDERAVAQLIEATRDQDWWVSERAVDALAEIGSTKALPRFIEMLQAGEAKSLPTVIRAIGKIGDTRVIEHLLPMLQRPENEIKVEAIAALAKLADERRADTIRSAPAGGDEQRGRHPQPGRRPRHARARQPLLDPADRGQQARGKDAGARQDAAHRQRGAGERGQAGEETAAAAKLDIATLKPGDVIEGRYKFIEKIGKGAFGTVLAHGRHGGRGAPDSQVLEPQRFLRRGNDEALRARAALQPQDHAQERHPHLRLPVHPRQLRDLDGILSPRTRLGGEIVNEKPVALKRAVKFGIDIATGMAVAHQAGIVHRDLKPANVLIDNDSLLKIVDFGVAAAQSQGDTQLTKTGYVIGSPKYMAPEQILGKKVDERADIYSLGVILYEMFAGVPPYSRGDHMSVMYQHVQGKARRPSRSTRICPWNSIIS